MDRMEKMERLQDAIEHLGFALDAIAPISAADPHFNAYIYEKLRELSDNANPYNSSLSSELAKVEASFDADLVDQ